MANRAPLSQRSVNRCLLSRPHFLLTLLSVADTLKNPRFCHRFDLDRSRFCSFRPSSCHSPLPASFTKKISHLHLIILTSLTHFICSPSLHALPPLITRCLKPFLPGHDSFTYCLCFFLSPGLMSFPLHWISSSLSHSCMCYFSYAPLRSSFAKLCTIFFSPLPAYV